MATEALNTIEKLKEQLELKQEELETISLNIFVYNPRISVLISEIMALEDEIKEMEVENGK